MKTAPLLSIGMIFKNEERCIERCLKSLEPLRRAIPCELVMADTGAEDGSRAIAEKYADEVFDFEWIDDFSAARNAVMDRCTGKWYMSIDCDEWLDKDISELTAFLKKKPKVDFAFVILRDYISKELEKSELYSDFHALRLMRMGTGERFHGAIHESWAYREPTERLNHTLFHHDGYFFSDAESQKKKKQRNMKLLREKLRETPEDLRTLNQCIESGNADADFIQYIQRAVKLIKDRRGQWESYGPVIMSHAVEVARVGEMPELEDWISFAETQFPDSIYVQVGLNHTAFMTAYEKKEWETVIRYGESYRKGLCAFRAARNSPHSKLDLHLGSPRFCDTISEERLLTGLANAYLQSKEGEKALQILTELDGQQLAADQVRNVIVALSQIHAETELNAAPVLTAFYEQISRDEPNQQKRQARLAAFNAIAMASFAKGYREEEQEHDGYWRPAFTIFLALADKCEAGRGAAIMTTDDPAEMRAILEQVEEWPNLPREALEHALAAGVPFPLPGKPLPVETLDGLAAKLTAGKNTARRLALSLADNQEFSDLQSLYWAQSLVLAALRTFDWKLGKRDENVSEFYCPAKKKDEKEPEKPPECTAEDGLALIRRFANVESRLLPLFYTPQMLTEEAAALLAPMHRWGFYCIRALRALDAGKPREYLAALRKGLKACPGEKSIVQFLLDRFLEDARPKADPELLALAEKVGAILSRYDPDSPAVKAIRDSDAYKQVSWLIEPAGVPVQ